LSAQAADKARLFVDDVVTALTGSVQPSGDARGVFEDQMKRATEEFDLRTAEAFARALLEALCQEPIDPRRLEALLILGLAHPTILDRHRISLQKEGDRLAAMLEAQGQHDRARTLLDVIENAMNAEEATAKAASPDAKTADSPAPGAVVPPSPGPLDRDRARIEVLLRQADDAAARGRTGQAILLLQEVVALDRHRRDVARMIRDLRWQEQERRVRSIRRLKFISFVLVLAAAVVGVGWRENDVRQRFAQIPSARSGDLKSLSVRLERIDLLFEQEHVWFGMASAMTERKELQREVFELQAIAAAKASELASERARTAEFAEAQRSRGMLLAQQGRFEDALVELRRALAAGGDAWPARRDVETNVKAIAEWIEKRPVREGNGR
jgi:tetratricopeptide (TPR) repeat protein